MPRWFRSTLGAAALGLGLAFACAPPLMAADGAVAAGFCQEKLHANDISSTLTNHNEVFLKSAQILNAIREGNYIQNAAEMGRYFMTRSRAVYGDSPVDQTRAAREVRGKGLMLHGCGTTANLVGYAGRLLPYMDITKDEIDSLYGGPPPDGSP